MPATGLSLTKLDWDLQQAECYMEKVPGIWQERVDFAGFMYVLSCGLRLRHRAWGAAVPSPEMTITLGTHMFSGLPTKMDRRCFFEVFQFHQLEIEYLQLCQGGENKAVAVLRTSIAWAAFHTGSHAPPPLQ